MKRPTGFTGFQAKSLRPDDQFIWTVAQIPFGPQVVQDYPEVQSFVRFFNMPRAVYKFEDKEFNEENFYYADSTLFDIFTYKVIKGDARSALLEPNKIVLTERIATKYFGNTDPIGKTLTSGTNTYEVTGVIKNIPRNSHFRFDALPQGIIFLNSMDHGEILGYLPTCFSRKILMLNHLKKSCKKCMNSFMQSIIRAFEYKD